jgi:methylmalonyl-CoA/ethylmalonyl-CoA epimerase
LLPREEAVTHEQRTEEPVRAWRVTRLHHVAFAHQADDTPNLLADLLGLPIASEESAEGFVERMLPVGESNLQLLQPTGPGVVGRFVERRGPGLHHIAVEVSDLEGAMADLLRRGVRMVDSAPRPGGMGTRIAFLHPEATGGLLVELVGPPPGDGAAGREDPAAGRT